MIETKEDLIELVSRYSRRLLGKMEDLYDNEVLSRFNDYRETIEKGIEKYGIDKELEAKMFEADKQLIIYIDHVLYWWDKDGLFELREEYISTIIKEQWYWWFDEIKNGSYPFEMVPEHLKEVCKNFYK